MSIIEAIFLGIIQGLTEFLPVSSSGHLVLFSHLLEVKEPSIVFEVLVHVGTLIAVVVVFWKEIAILITSFFKLLSKPSEAPRLCRTDPGCRLLSAVICATLPVVVFALLFKDKIEALYMSPLFVGFMLIITGTILFVTDRLRVKRKDLEYITMLDALIIGVGQAVAVLPGISRSGTTIGVGLARGLTRESAARFSFLLTIPAILGALVFAIGDLVNGAVTISIGAIIAGLLASAITGYLAIHLLLELVKRGKLIWFSYYTWAVGILVVLLSIL